MKCNKGDERFDLDWAIYPSLKNSKQKYNAKNNDKLSDSSKANLKDELGKRGYDINSNEFSSKYSPDEIKSHVIPNGDNSNPASDIQNTDKINKNKSDFPADFKPSF